MAERKCAGCGKIKNRDELRLKGELLTANIYSIKKGMTTVELPNYLFSNFKTN